MYTTYIFIYLVKLVFFPEKEIFEIRTLSFILVVLKYSNNYFPKPATSIILGKDTVENLQWKLNGFKPESSFRKQNYLEC